MESTPEQLQVSPPEDWNVVDRKDEYVSLTHDERDVAVIAEEFEVTRDDVRSRSGTDSARTVFEVGYQPPEVESKSLHVSTVRSPGTAERLILEAIQALDE